MSLRSSSALPKPSDPVRKINPDVRALVRQAASAELRPMIFLSMDEQEYALAELRNHGGLRTDRQICDTLNLDYEHYQNTLCSTQFQDWAESMQRLRRGQENECKQLVAIRVHQALVSQVDLTMADLREAVTTLGKLQALERNDGPEQPSRVRKALLGQQPPQLGGGPLGNEKYVPSGENPPVQASDSRGQAAGANGWNAQAASGDGIEACDHDDLGDAGDPPIFDLPLQPRREK